MLSRIPKPVKSAVKLAIYVGGIAVVTFINGPEVLEKVGLTGFIATAVAALFKGMLTALTLRKQRTEDEFYGR